MKRIITALLVIIASSCLFSQETLKTMFSDTPPKFLRTDDGEFSGICFELLTLISKETGIIFEYPDAFVPMPRIYSNLENGCIDLCLGLRKNKKREHDYIIGESLYDVSYKVVVRYDDKLKINSLADISGGNKIFVLTIFGSGSVSFLRNLGLAVDDGGRTMEASLKKLLHYRGRAFIYYNIAIAHGIKNLPEFGGEVRVLDNDFSPYSHYVMFSKSVSPGLIDLINCSIRKLRSTEKWKRIIREYTEIDDSFK